MSYAKTVTTVFLVAAVLASMGCAGLLVGATAGAGSAIYAKGNLETRLQADINRSWEATVTAVRGIGFEIEKRNMDQTSAKLEARTADEKTVTIDLESKGNEETKIWIRVGVFGDEDRSRRILDKIKSRL